MISALTGIVKHTYPQQLTLEVGPLECTLQIPNSALYVTGIAIHVHVYMHWNAENGPTFYGFATSLDKALFMLIISCSGIGPKIGLTALAHLGSQHIIEAIQLGDVRALSSISGIGAKKAEQIIVQLKHKIATLIESNITNSHTTDKNSPGARKVEQWHTINLALESLNYSRPEISMALDHLRIISAEQELPFDQLLRKALTFLAK